MGSGGVCVDDGIGRGPGQGGWDQARTGSARMGSGGDWVNEDGIGRRLALRGRGWMETPAWRDIESEVFLSSLILF